MADTPKEMIEKARLAAAVRAQLALIELSGVGAPAIPTSGPGCRRSSQPIHSRPDANGHASSPFASPTRMVAFVLTLRLTEANFPVVTDSIRVTDTYLEADLRKAPIMWNARA